MTTQEITLVALARLWAKGRITFEQAVNLGAKLNEPKTVRENGDEPYGGRAHEGNHENTFAAVMGLAGDVLTVEQAHEYVAAVATVRSNR